MRERLGLEVLVFGVSSLSPHHRLSNPVKSVEKRVVETVLPTPVTRGAPFKPIPPAYWDDAARTWGRQVYIKANAHQFQYYEADLLISSVLKPGMKVLEIGCGTGDSTLVHAREVRSLVATDVSRRMVEKARMRAALREFRQRLRFALVDGCHLPFKDSSFDAVIGRGVALSYVREPARALREIRRVLRPGGRVAIDAMNALSPGHRNPRKARFRTVRMLGGKPVYMEQFNDGDLQVRRVFYLRAKAPLARYVRKSKVFKVRPRTLSGQVIRVERLHARYFPEPRLRQFAEGAGLSDVEIVPLGQMYRLLTSEDHTLRDFALRNRRALSRLAIELRHHFKVSSGFHVMLMATSPRN